MWEPWEFRSDDIDLSALADAGVPIIGTNEHHPEVRTFDYLGPTVGRLLLDVGIELVNSRLRVIGSDPFGTAIATWLRNAGAQAIGGCPEEGEERRLDAVVVAEHRNPQTVLTANQLSRLAQAGVPVVRLCGRVDSEAGSDGGAAVYPPVSAEPGTMTVTTAYAGVRPVVDLHAAGLRAGGDVVLARRAGASVEDSIRAAVQGGYGLALA
jgi:hypothetical protein